VLRCLPQFEVWVYHSVGETFTANTDTFKYTVTCQLVHYQVRVNYTYEKIRFHEFKSINYLTNIIHELIILKETYQAVSIHWE